MADHNAVCALRVGNSSSRASHLLRAVVALFFCALAAPLGATSIEEAIPGSSYTKYSPALAVHAWEIAATVSQLQEPRSCKTAKLIDRKVTSIQEQVVFYSDRRLKQGRWSEIWTFDKCGTRVRVQADFQADGKGTADGEFKPI